MAERALLRNNLWTHVRGTGVQNFHWAAGGMEFGAGLMGGKGEGEKGAKSNG